MGVQLENIAPAFWARFGKGHALKTHQIPRVIPISDSEGRVYCLTFFVPHRITRLSPSTHTTHASVGSGIIF